MGVSALAIREVTEAVGAHRETASRDLVPRLFEAFRAQHAPWLLDSGTSDGERARFSFMGADPYLIVRARGTDCAFEWRRAVVPGEDVGTRSEGGDPIALALGQLPTLDDAGDAEAHFGEVPPFLAGAVGYLGYELAEVCEPVALSARDDFGLPDLLLLYSDRLALVDHETGRVYAVGLGFGEGDDLDAARTAAGLARDAVATTLLDRGPGQARTPSATAVPPTRWVLDRTLPADARESLGPRDYAAAVETIRGEIAAGNVYQANLTQRIDLAAGEAASGWALHRALREINPAPYSAYLGLPEVEIVSSSPECFLRLDAQGAVESRPIKGTRRRGASEEEDSLLAKELEVSEKDRAENLMIVDLVRNDLGRVCETGSVEVPDLMAIEPYATVHQMVSTVRGRLRSECDRSDLLHATFPPGSMTGAPKIAAMELIDRVEPVRRGIYSGAIGYFDVRGGLDLSVVIRTLLVRDGEIHLHGGGAVVSDSEPEAEYREALDKVRALLAALDCCE